MGIDTLKFVMPDHFYQSPEENLENECFCTRPADDREICKISGVLDISSCKEGAPILISAPHFFKGSPSLLEHFSGLKPDKSQHESLLEVEPVGLFTSMQLDLDQLFFSANGISS